MYATALSNPFVTRIPAINAAHRVNFTAPVAPRTALASTCARFTGIRLNNLSQQSALVGRRALNVRADMLEDLMKAMTGSKERIPTKEDCLPGNSTPIKVTNKHFITKNPIQGPFPANLKKTIFGTGCFWGTEKGFWRLPGVYSTAVGYSAGFTENATYEQVCSGRTYQNEVVQVVYDPAKISYADLLTMFWAQHDPTQGMGQGNDRGTQYRSGIYYDDDEQKELAMASKEAFQEKISAKGYGTITTEIIPATEFYFAEDYHQQYLAKPGARPYCSAQPTGIPLGAEWLPKETADANAYKIPASFWADKGPRPGCTINGPNEQFVF